MNSITAPFVMRSNSGAPSRVWRLFTSLLFIHQFPRRSSLSQPNTLGTFGHFCIARLTMSSIGSRRDAAAPKNNRLPPRATMPRGSARYTPAPLRQPTTHPVMARTAYPDTPEASLAPLVERIERERGGKLLNLYRMLLHSPPVAQGWLGLFTAIRQQ